jgi:predicted nucleic acid-binding Zn finger protein
MTVQQLATRDERAKDLMVFEIGSGQFYVESSTGKVCYRVTLDEMSCACSDYALNIGKDEGFVCKHILAAQNAGETIHLFEKDRIRLDERFITTIKGNEFVKYAGLLDLAHQKKLKKLSVEAVQYPTKENGLEAICKASAETKDGEVFTELGDASPGNVNKEVAEHILRIAATRAKARVLRDMTNIGMTCLEELGDLNTVAGDAGKPADNVRKFSRKEVKPERKEASAPEQKETAKGQSEPIRPADQKKESVKPVTKISPAQKTAIENISKRRGFSPEKVEEMAEKQFGVKLDEVSAADAAQFIRHLQQAA